jgi:hypothetical protein
VAKWLVRTKYHTNKIDKYTTNTNLNPASSCDRLIYYNNHIVSYFLDEMDLVIQPSFGFEKRSFASCFKVNLFLGFFNIRNTLDLGKPGLVRKGVILSFAEKRRLL